MNTRIRYRKTSEPNVVESVRKFPHPTNGATYKVRINEANLEYHIIEDTADVLVQNGRAVNLHQVKIKAKNALAQLGIEFAEEGTRMRKAAEQVA